MKILRTASIGSSFIGSYKKECSISVPILDLYNFKCFSDNLQSIYAHLQACKIFHSKLGKSALRSFIGFLEQLSSAMLMKVSKFQG